MKKRHIAVCCEEQEYVRRFVDFMSVRKDSLFAVHGFSDIKSLEGYVREHPAEILLLSENMLNAYGTDAAADGAAKIFLLTDKEYSEVSGYPAVYMLQSCMDILRRVEDMYAEQSVLPAGAAVRTRNIKKLAVYSPVGRCGKTTFAITMGKEISMQSKTLYLNMEEYSGFGALYPDAGQTLSDLMYFLKQGKTDFACKLEASVRKLGCLDYIPPVKSPLEYTSVTKKDWESLIYMIASESLYDFLILDMGSLPAGFMGILEDCDFVYTPVSGDETARAKTAQYKEALKTMGRESILGHSSIFEPADVEELEQTARAEGRRWRA